MGRRKMRRVLEASVNRPGQEQQALRWARRELALLEASAVRNPGQEQAMRVVISRLERRYWK